MPKWNEGSEVVERLLDDRDLESVPADSGTVERLVDSARRHVSSASSTAASDPEGALALAYDAARKAATALLAHQGLRPTSAGGHIAVVDAVNAQFPGVQPCIKGARVLVTVVLDALAAGLDAATIVEHYPTLTVDGVRAAPAYGAWLAKQEIRPLTPT